MKRFFFALLFALLCSTVFAQVEKSIIIDQNSFRPVQTDALTGVNIDPIQLDYSKRPCARLKVKINRMTVAEIDQLKVKVVTNNAVMKTQTAQYDMGLIIEMTAKPNTRFYFNHPEYGDSNEVCLNLDANKEYYIEAYLNQLYSIVVNSNVAEAEVYIDNVFKGYTDSSNSLVIKDMLVGDHILKVVYGGISQEQKIVVNSGSISFRQDINTSASKPQFVVFSVVPQGAVLTIDGKYQTLYDGVCSIVLPNGRYSYSVSAKNYHTQSDSFVVAGNKVEKQVILKPAFGWLQISGNSVEGASVFVDDEFVGKAPLTTQAIASGKHTLRIVKELYQPYVEQVVINDNSTTTVSANLAANYAIVQLKADNAEIWINGRKVGNSMWAGQLAPGTYLFESRKENHQNGVLSQNITIDVAQQSYTLPAPKPITGSMLIMTTPAMANVVIDGKMVGRTPIELNDVIIGKHLVTIAKEGYVGTTNEYLVQEGKTQSINITLQKGSAAQSSIPSSTPQQKVSAGKIYRVGDYYEGNGLKGVVFDISADGRTAKIVNLHHKREFVVWCNSSSEYTKLIGANDLEDGSKNMAVVKSRPNWQTNYPAFKACANLGPGWYLPAKNELHKLFKNQQTFDAVNKTLAAKGGTLLPDAQKKGWFWSSTEDKYKSSDSYSAHHLRVSDGYLGPYTKKNDLYVIAVAKVALNGGASVNTPVHYTTTSTARYKVGDLYNENGVKGVVFSVSADGRSGKIVSMKGSDGGVLWASSKSCQKKLLGLNDNHDGENNMATVMRQDNWRSNYPAFDYCASLGNGWYLPAVEELKLLLLNDSVHDAVNRTLDANGGTKLYNKGDPKWYWSSTEGTYVTSDKVHSAKLVRMNYKDVGEHGKDLSYTFTNIRAIRKIQVGASPTPAYTTSNTSYSGAKYRVGDYYTKNGVKGVVFEVDASGLRGKIISVECSNNELAWCLTSYEQRRYIGANSLTDGEYNQNVVKSIKDWQINYPAFAWCANLGDGWYLPSKEEWVTINSVKSKIENKLSRQLNIYFWTSSEVDEVYKGEYCVWNLCENQYTTYCKSRTNKVFAVAKFDESGATSYSYSNNSAKTYKIGDYYDDGVKQGVVFAVENGGRNGKILSLKHTKGLFWTSDSAEQNRSIGAKSSADGMVNMDAVKRIANWQSKYPAFRWCANLGSGWYLPAKDEVKAIVAANTIVNKTLVAKGGDKVYISGDKDYYLSSTEDSDPSYIFIYRLMIDNVARNKKDNNNNTTIRAVARF